MNERRDYYADPVYDVQEPMGYQEGYQQNYQPDYQPDYQNYQNYQPDYQDYQQEYYYEQAPAPAEQSVAPEFDETAIEDEHIRYLNETKKLEKQKAEDKQAAASEGVVSKDDVKKAAEKGAALIEARMNYDAGVGATDLAIELLKFSDHSSAQKKEYKEYKRKRNIIKKSIKTAKKLEKEATKRYYEVLAKESKSLTILKKAKKQEELSYILTKLENLLKEREELDAELSTLYRGAETVSGGKIRERAEKKKLKKAKKIRKILKSTDRRVSKMEVPQPLKTKIRFLLNTKIVTEAALTYSKYLLKKLKPQGDARKELKRNIKSAQDSLRRLESSLKRMVNKAERFVRSRKRRYTLIKVFTVVLLSAAIAAVVIIGG